MKYSRLLCFTALAGAFTAAPASATVAIDGDPVLYWNEVLLSVLSGSPTAGGRSIAMINVAIHDAVNASLGRPDRSWLPSGIGSTGDVRAAASVAAHNMLVALYPANVAAIDAALTASLALIPNSSTKTSGMATGAAVASAMLAARANDGANRPSTYVPVGGPGHWVPTPPGFAAPGLPQYADVDPFLIASPEVFRAAAPPAIDTPEYAAFLNEVRDIGGATSATRTADQSAAAAFWAPLPANGTGPWIRTAIDASGAQGLSTLENARMLAQLSVAVADATIATWDTKYYYDYWRPVTAIQNAGIDGNPLTEADLDWLPFIVTPAHPSYLSAHSSVAAAAAAILNANLGSNLSFCLTIAGNNRCWEDFDAAALDAANSRLWGGIHYRFDNEAGLELGAKVAAFTLTSSTFNSVPEPTSWTLMIGGFAMTGAFLRRRRIVVALAV
jgi:hypothetical protein